ncbi:hypothetical protein BDZ90DRAFT_263031 [Jaminaea rosea]|uniref:Uncharacterized protein n=1 Tax=Jaminaea rosea TaxID=1569628 RepID=A0A316UHK5_9BASI|nr:hypothetical protein BDZ90DRAFT_263031 [Jaminaea rosea]PWN24817.1 hypothetical protein BDZ90DRAFT_263031 [Jaminaea rosea]
MATTTTILRAKTPTFVQHPYSRSHTAPPCRPLRVVKKSSQNQVDKSSPIHTPNQTRSSSPVHFNKQRAGEQERERERDRKAGAPTGLPPRPLVKAASFELISSSRPLAVEKHQPEKPKIQIAPTPKVEINIVDKSTVVPMTLMSKPKTRALARIKKTLNAVDLTKWESELSPSNMIQEHEAAAAAAAVAAATTPKSKSASPESLIPIVNVGRGRTREPIKVALTRTNFFQMAEIQETPVKFKGLPISPPMPVNTGLERLARSREVMAGATLGIAMAHHLSSPPLAAVATASTVGTFPPPRPRRPPPRRETLPHAQPQQQFQEQHYTMPTAMQRTARSKDSAEHFERRRRLSEAYCDLDMDVEVLINEIQMHEGRKGKAGGYREAHRDV